MTSRYPDRTSRYVVGQYRPDGTFDIYRSAKTEDGARKARREISHWPNAKIIDQDKERPRFY